MDPFNSRHQKRWRRDYRRHRNAYHASITPTSSLFIFWTTCLIAASLIDRCSGNQLLQTGASPSLRGKIGNDHERVDANRPSYQLQISDHAVSSPMHHDEGKRRELDTDAYSMVVDLTLSLSYVDMATANLLASPDPTKDIVTKRFCESVNDQAGGPQATASATKDSLTLFVSEYDPYEGTPSCAILTTDFIPSNTDPQLGSSLFTVVVSVAQTVLAAPADSSGGDGESITMERVKGHVEEGFLRGGGGQLSFIDKLKRTSPEVVPGFDRVDNVRVLDGASTLEERPYPSSAGENVFNLDGVPFDSSNVLRSTKDPSTNNDDPTINDAGEKQELSSLENPLTDIDTSSNGSSSTDLRPVVIAGVAGAAAAVLVAVLFSVYFLRRRTKESMRASGNRSTSNLIQPPPPARSKKQKKKKKKALADRDMILVPKYADSSPRAKSRNRHHREDLVPPARHPLDNPPPVPSVVDLNECSSVDASTLEDGTAGRGKLFPVVNPASTSVRRPERDEMLGTAPKSVASRGPNLASFLAGGSVQLSDMDIGQNMGQSGRISNGGGTSTPGNEQDFSIDMGYSLESAIKEEMETNSLVVASTSDSSSEDEDDDGEEKKEEKILRGDSEKGEWSKNSNNQRNNYLEESYSTGPTSSETDGENDNIESSSTTDDDDTDKYDSNRLKAILRKNFSNLGFSVDYEDELLFPPSPNTSQLESHDKEEPTNPESIPPNETTVQSVSKALEKDENSDGRGQFSPPQSDDGSDWKSLPPEMRDAWKSLVSLDTPVAGSNSRKRPQTDAWVEDAPPISTLAPVSPAKSKVDPNTAEFKPDLLASPVTPAQVTPFPSYATRSDGKDDGEVEAPSLAQAKSCELDNPRKLDSVLKVLDTSSSSSRGPDEQLPLDLDVSGDGSISCRPESACTAKDLSELRMKQIAQANFAEITETPGRSDIVITPHHSASEGRRSVSPFCSPPTATSTITTTGPLSTENDSVNIPNKEKLVDTHLNDAATENDVVVILPENTELIQSDEENQQGTLASTSRDDSGLGTASLKKIQDGDLSESGSFVPPSVNIPSENDLRTKTLEEDDESSTSSVGMVNPWLFDAADKTHGPRKDHPNIELDGERSNQPRQSSRQRGIKGCVDSLDSGSRKSSCVRGSEINRGVTSDRIRLDMQLSMLNAKELELIRSSTSYSSGGSSVAGSTATSSSRSSARSHASSKYSVGRTRLDVTAPPGKLGIILANRSEGHGTVVSDVRVSSVLAGKILPGDRIIAIDGKDVSALTVSKITQIMSEKAKAERVLSILTPSSGGRGRTHHVSSDSKMR